MPIERNQTDLKLYYAVMNEDGTYGEPQPLEECKFIEIERIEDSGIIACSHCHILFYRKTDFCPNCGRRMKNG